MSTDAAVAPEVSAVKASALPNSIFLIIEFAFNNLRIFFKIITVYPFTQPSNSCAK